jgi:hypothetical protein
MSFNQLSVAGGTTSDGERFCALVKERSEYLDPDSGSKGEFVSCAASDHPLHAELAKAGIKPYELHTEAELRSRLKAIGLTEDEINTKFWSARKHMTTITISAAQARR